MLIETIETVQNKFLFNLNQYSSLISERFCGGCWRWWSIGIVGIGSLLVLIQVAFYYLQSATGDCGNNHNNNNQQTQSSSEINNKLNKMIKLRSKSKVKFGGGGAGVLSAADFAKIQYESNVDYEKQSNVDYTTMERYPKYYNENNCQLMNYLYDDAQTLLESMERGCRLNPDGNCLGRVDPIAKSVTWTAYKTIMERIEKFGNGIEMIMDGADFRSRKNPACIGIYSSNCVEYIVAEYGCYWHSFVVVPIYDTLGPNICSFIANQTEIECIICDKLERIQIILSQDSVFKSLRYIVTFTDIPQSYKLKALSFGIKVISIEELEQIGAANVLTPNKPKPDSLAVICYTSGTTDTPKGVMLSHRNVVANVSAVMYQMLEHTPKIDDILLSYLPLAHMFERCCQTALYMVGGAVVFFSGDIKSLSNDMKIAMPTVLPAVPRLLTRIFCKIHDSVKGNIVKNFLLNTACHFKQRQYDKGTVSYNTVWDRIVFRKIRESLGGKIRLIMCGSAPLNPNVLDFLRCTLGCEILEGYGQTECVAPCTVTYPGDFKSGNPGDLGSVGPPISAAIVKLIDVPEMGYLSKENKGEILVKGPILFQGYFKDPERTAKAVDSDGWLHTGDIGCFNDNQTLKIIDRKKNIFKLSQGEYIAPEKIENIYSQSSFVAQIFVYGESLKSSLIAILVPDQVVLELWARNNNNEAENFKELCLNKDVKKMILKELYLLGQRNGLKSFEQIKDCYLHSELLTIESGMLTPTLKSKRMEIFKHFKTEIDSIYSRLE